MNAPAITHCPTTEFEGYLNALRQGGQPAGGPGGAYPYPRGESPNPYGCPSDCIGVHQYGLISATGMTGVDASGNCPAGTQCVITVQPQKKNQPRRMFLMEEVATQFIGNDLVIGAEPVFAARVPFGMAQWVPNSHCMDWRRIICEVSQTIACTVTNRDADPHPFVATIEAYMLA